VEETMTIRTPFFARCIGLLSIVPVLAGCSDSPSEPIEPAAMIVPAAALEFDYVKVESGPNTLNWFGDVTGDIDGRLETRVVSAWQSGPVLHIQTEWYVGGSSFSFYAELSGTLHTGTGALNLNGVVTGGWMAGAQIHNSGQLTGIDGTTGGTVFEGSAKLMPGTAN
jgi:hypothetical protein